jgi:hypothetical protein
MDLPKPKHRLTKTRLENLEEKLDNLQRDICNGCLNAHLECDNCYNYSKLLRFK